MYVLGVKLWDRGVSFWYVNAHYFGLFNGIGPFKVAMAISANGSEGEAFLFTFFSWDRVFKRFVFASMFYRVIAYFQVRDQVFRLIHFRRSLFFRR